MSLTDFYDVDEKLFLDGASFAKVITDENGHDAILIAGRVYKLEGRGKLHTELFVKALRSMRSDGVSSGLVPGYATVGKIQASDA